LEDLNPAGASEAIALAGRQRVEKLVVGLYLSL